MTRTVRPRTLRRIASRERQRGYLGLGSYRRLAANALSGPSFAASLLTSIVPDKAAPGTTPTFTRATTKTFTDWEGVVRTAIAGEACFTGARRVRNVTPGSSQDFTNAAWTTGTGGTGVGVTRTANFAAAPDGTQTASRLQFNTGAGSTSADFAFVENVAVLVGSTATRSVWLRSNTGGNVTLFSVERQGASNVTITVTPQWQRFSATTVTGSFAAGQRIMARGDATQSPDVLAWGAQYEDVTGQSNQNPGEYVSVGVLSAPFQGAGVDGVQYFATQNGNTVASNVVTAGTGAALGLTKQQSAYLPGVAASYFSTPDAVANRITGDIDLRVQVSSAYSTAAGGTVVGKDNTTSSRSYVLQIGSNGAGRPRFFYTSDGSTTTGRIADCSALLQTVTADNTAIWVRATYIAATGVVTFYTAPDGATWTQLGTPVTITSGAPFAGSVVVSAGGSSTGSNPFSGTIYRAQIYNGVAGALVADFNPQDYTSGATWASSTTGETWTKNGTAQIINNPLLGYSEWQASTNLCLQSEDIATTWLAEQATIGTAVVAPDGATTAKKIQETAVAGTHDVVQSFTKAASSLTYTASAYFKQAERTWAFIACDDTVNGVRAWFNIGAGTLGSTALAGAGFTVVGSTITPAPNGFFRCTVTFTTTTSTSLRLLLLATTGDTVLTYTGVLNSGVYAWGAVLEQIGFATPYIPTTTVAVTRNADVPTLPAAGNVSTSAQTAYAEVVPSSTAVSVIAAYGPTGVDSWALFTSTAAALRQQLFASSVTVEDIQTVSTLTIGAINKVASKYSPTDSGLFLAGAKSGTTANPSGVPATPTTMYIGSQSAGTYLNGNIRNVKIWTRALTDAQLQAMTA